jgi:hypothetical protein
LIGELMFIAINTQPLIAQPVNALARFMTNANSELYVIAKGVFTISKRCQISEDRLVCIAR